MGGGRFVKCRRLGLRRLSEQVDGSLRNTVKNNLLKNLKTNGNFLKINIFNHKKINPMKKLLLTLFVACFAVFAYAQDAPKKPTSFVWNKTSLTEIGCDAEQIKKISAINKEATEKTKQIKEDSTLDEKAQKSAIKVATKERNEARLAVLTDEQKKKVEEISKKLKEEAKAGSEN